MDAEADVKIAEARGVEPWLGVHALTEFVFCARAGLIEFEKKSSDEGDEAQREPWANLSYMPLYDVRDIEERIAREIRRTAWLLVASLLLIPLTMAAYLHFGVWWLLVALATYLVLLKLLATVFGTMELHWLRHRALTTPGCEPDVSRTEHPDVDWWEMLRAGFDPRPSLEGFHGEELRLSGKPWRVLVRRSTRIPVFKKRHCAGDNGHRIYPQHEVRIAAYCRLIEEAEGADSPYGIVLFDDCYKGVAISAFTAGAQSRLRQAIDDARDVIADSLHSKLPDPPEERKLCSRCPVGRPRAYRQGKTETIQAGVPLPIFAAVGADGRTYHSACGDRFLWLPPHHRVTEKGLAPTDSEPAQVGTSSGRAP